MRQFNTKHIRDLLTFGNPPIENIKYVTDDLFGDLHKDHNLTEPDLWTEPFLLNRSFSDLWIPSPRKPLPAYTVDAMYHRLVFARESWMYRTVLLHHKYYGYILSQPNLAPNLLETELDWLDKYFPAGITAPYDPGMAASVSAFERRKIIAKHRNLPPARLLALCASPDETIRNCAMMNPSCPEEGRVVVAMASGI